MDPQDPDGVWLRHDQVPIGTHVLDCRGNRLDRVTALCVVPGGIRVKVLGTVDGGQLAVLNPELKPDTYRVVEFEGYLIGAHVVYGDQSSCSK